MDFIELAKIEDEFTQIAKTYEIFNEDTRLNRSQAARVEFLTTVHYIEQYLKPNDRILDIGAGAGEYSLYFARNGYQVSAIELADRNIQAFQKKLTSVDRVELRQGNAIDLSFWSEAAFDVVLLFGPLYHLHREEDRQRCIAEAKRVCKTGGTLFFAFIAHDMVFFTELQNNPNYFRTGDYDHDTLRLHDFPFVFHTVDECRRILRDGGIRIVREIASDGLSELMEDRINSLDAESYAQYLRYHLHTCEKPEMLGHSNHLLFVGKQS